MRRGDWNKGKKGRNKRIGQRRGKLMAVMRKDD